MDIRHNIGKEELTGMKLKGKIIEKGLSVKIVAERMGLDITTLRRKLKDLKRFKIGEAMMIAQILGLSKKELSDIFFG